MDCRAGEQTIRIRACNLILGVDGELNQASGECPWLFVFLEDCSAILARRTMDGAEEIQSN
jgi:hypothetical protein